MGLENTYSLVQNTTFKELIEICQWVVEFSAGPCFQLILLSFGLNCWLSTVRKAMDGISVLLISYSLIHVSASYYDAMKIITFVCKCRSKGNDVVT